jgi:CRP-like cAMP-binding protein
MGDNLEEEMDRNQEIADQLAGFSLFSDLSSAQLRGVVDQLEEVSFQPGERVMRQALGGSNFNVILDGDVEVQVDGENRARLARGDYFGEVSVLLGEPSTADVVALTELRVLALPASRLSEFLFSHPQVMYRMLQAQSRRLRRANQWRS